MDLYVCMYLFLPILNVIITKSLTNDIYKPEKSINKEKERLEG